MISNYHKILENLIKINPCVIKYFNQEIKNKIINKWFLNLPELIEHMENPTNDMCLYAIKKTSLKYIPFHCVTWEIIEEALKISQCNYAYIYLNKYSEKLALKVCISILLHVDSDVKFISSRTTIVNYLINPDNLLKLLLYANEEKILKKVLDELTNVFREYKYQGKTLQLTNVINEILKNDFETYLIFNQINIYTCVFDRYPSITKRIDNINAFKIIFSHSLYNNYKPNVNINIIKHLDTELITYDLCVRAYNTDKSLWKYFPLKYKILFIV
jgi:hypothetical protein